MFRTLDIDACEPFFFWSALSRSAGKGTIFWEMRIAGPVSHHEAYSDLCWRGECLTPEVTRYGYFTHFAQEEFDNLQLLESTQKLQIRSTTWESLSVSWLWKCLLAETSIYFCNMIGSDMVMWTLNDDTELPFGLAIKFKDVSTAQD